MGTASMTTGQFREFAGAVLRSLPDNLDPTAAQGWIENQEGLRKVLHEALSPAGFKYDKQEDGWELLEDIRFSPIDPAELELVSFLKPGESFINGDEMVRRARTELRANLGQRHAEYLMEHQKEIPVEFREYYLVFTGTVWCRSGGNRRVACLRWGGPRWVLHFHWLENDWGSYGRLVRPRE